MFDDTNNDGFENYQDTLEGPIAVTRVSADDSFTIATDLESAASFTSDDADGEGELNLTVLGDIEGGLTATDFSDVNITVGTNELLEDVVGDEAEDINLNTLALDDDAVVTVTGEAATLTIAGVVTSSTTVGAYNRGVTIDASAFAGDAFITGGAGEDTLIGGSGDDVLNGGPEITITGPEGANPNAATDIVVSTTDGDIDDPETDGVNEAVAQVSTVTVDEATTYDAGDVFTLTVNGVELTYTAEAGDDARDIELGLLQAFDDSDDLALEDLSAEFTGGDLVINGATDGTPFEIAVAVANAAAPFQAEAGVDTFTGNGGDDTFLIATRDITGSNGAQVELEADTITDFSDGDVISFLGNGGDIFGGSEGSVSNYSEGPVTGFGNVQGALTAANSDFAANEDLLYSAQQVGSDVYIFANLDGADLLADQVVHLEGVSLADLANDGSFIVALEAAPAFAAAELSSAGSVMA